ncbi:MAG: aminotransferase class I/II-fold pyridoxal phosphate-dependent enzyme [Pseudomonadota bacterium]
MVKISKRSEIEPFHAMDVLAEATRRAQAGYPIISLAVGQPAHPAPKVVIDSARNALLTERIAYTDALGTRQLKTKIASYYASRRGVSIDPARIAVTTGSSAAFNLAFLALFDPGDRVAITRPGYPAYRNILSALGLEPVEIAVSEAMDFTLDPRALEEAALAHGPIAGVLLASPANPTGTVTSKGALTRLVEYCEANRMAFISDEIYHGLSFAGEETTALSVTDQALVINSFSKYYCMTGWRIGWMVLPEHLIRPVERISQSLYISPPELSQIAACAAFDATAELDAIVSTYKANREVLMNRLPGIGFKIASPMDGAFYAYVDASAFTNDTMAFCKKMLNEINVAATPGRDFDPMEGHRTMRFSYAGSFDEISEAMDRIGAWLK